MKKNLILVLIPLAWTFSCANNNVKRDDTSVVREGQGVDDFEIKTLMTEDVKKDLGEDYDLIEWGLAEHKPHSIAIHYKKLGMNFFYYPFSAHKIFCISFDQQYQGKTSKGFAISKMNVADLIKIYGIPEWWGQDGDDSLVIAHYDKSGIYFNIHARTETPKEFNTYSSDDSIFYNKVHSYYLKVYGKDKIVEMVIGIPGSSF